MEPYRLFFPLGAVYAVAGAILWLLSAFGVLPYPATWHRMLMVQGFEQCFIVGFLLTALPGLTHAERTRPTEMLAAFVPLIAFGALVFAGLEGAAHAAFVLSIVVVAFAALRRIRRATQPPPVEFVFVGLGLLFGLTGGTLLALQSAGLTPDLPPRFLDRTLSLGMVLSLVLGVGGLLVPTFVGMRDPLEIPFVAKPHERKPRVRLYLIVIAMLVGAFACEAIGHPAAGNVVRAIAGTVVLGLVWKLTRLPARRDRSGFAMWGAGWGVFLGLWMLVLLPGTPMVGLHLVFLGGFGLLTVAIATRVVIAHGRHGLAAEPRVFGARVAWGVLAALVARITAEFLPGHGVVLFGLAGVLWSLAWILWLRNALPKIVRLTPTPPVLLRPEAPPRP